MEYSIKLTEEFLTEIDEICAYISDNLKAPNAAKRLIGVESRLLPQNFYYRI